MYCSFIQASHPPSPDGSERIMTTAVILITITINLRWFRWCLKAAMHIAISWAHIELLLRAKLWRVDMVHVDIQFINEL